MDTPSLPSGSTVTSTVGPVVETRFHTEHNTDGGLNLHKKDSQIHPRIGTGPSPSTVNPSMILHVVPSATLGITKSEDGQGLVCYTGIIPGWGLN